MALASMRMALNDRERRWLPWLGKTGKLSMRWATFLNRHRLEGLEQSFTGIAETRVNILQQWAQEQWQHLDALADQLAEGMPQVDADILRECRLGQALMLLQTSPWPVARIAAECGYDCASRFAVSFRQRYGLSPSALRATLPAG